MTPLRLPARAVALAFAALLALAAPAAAAAPVSAPSPSPSDPLSQTLDPNQGTGRGHVVLKEGHIDIGPREHDGAWSIAIHDDTKSPSLWRSPADVVIDVDDAAQLTAPTNPTYRFLGDAAGQKVWVIPQTQNRDVVWTGWNTQDPNVMSALSLGATFTFHGVQGPGNLFVFLQSGLAGAPQQLWSSTKHSAQKLFVETNTHTHANWVFTKPGVYLVDMEISGTLRSGKKVTDRQALRFAVGNATNPQQAFAAALPNPSPTSTGSSAAADNTGQDGSSSAAASATPAAATSNSGSGSNLTWVIVLIVAVLLVAAIVFTVLRQRGLKAHADNPGAP